MSISSRFVRLVGALAAPGAQGGRLSILIYHRVVERPDPLLPDLIDAPTFDAHMRELAHGFNVLPLADAVERLYAGTLPARAACITFDDGYRDNATIALPILRRHGLTATFFIATDYLDGGRMFNDTIIEALRRVPEGDIELPDASIIRVADNVASRRGAIGPIVGMIKYMPAHDRAAWAEQLAARVTEPLPRDLMMSSEQVRELARAGMEIGGHTRSHPILASIDRDSARREIAENRAVLQALVDQPIASFAYPNGVPYDDYHEDHVALAREAGYRAAVSTAWGVATRECDRFQLPRFTPWDRDARRFALRLLHNAWTRRHATRVQCDSAAA